MFQLCMISVIFIDDAKYEKLVTKVSEKLVMKVSEFECLILFDILTFVNLFSRLPTFYLFRMRH